MDSLKIPKGGSSGSAAGGAKSTGSVPITVRFNAGEECIDDIFQSFHNNSNNSGSGAGGGSGGTGGGGGGGGPNAGGGDSLSSSPSQHHQLQAQQNVDEVNTRNNFLQGNFFNRKRSGSIEGVSPTSSGPNLIAALSGNSDTASVGTWKLIKGKVSQTIEDIKSSKSSNQSLSSKADSQQPHSQNDQPDSDPDNATAHSSVSEDLPLDLERKTSTLHKGDSDSSLDSELQVESDTGERSRLRRSLANLKSKVKSKASNAANQHHHHHHHHHQRHQRQHPQPTGLATAALSSATISTAFGTAAIIPTSTATVNPPTVATMSKTDFTNLSPSRSFLRRRNRSPKNDDTNNEGAKGKSESTRKLSNVSSKKEIEIESGVEMMEDTIPASHVSSNELVGDNEPGTSKQKKDAFPDVVSHGTFRHDMGKSKYRLDPVNYKSPSSDGKSTSKQSSPSLFLGAAGESSYGFKNMVRRLPLIRITTFLLVLFIPVNSFLRGVLACLMSIAIADSLLEATFVTTPSEKSKFKIPDYSTMPICKVPAVEEHTTVKAYSGWMNEIFNYDPDKFHITMTAPVYVKLDGSILRVSSTLARIPRRAMWNEPPIDVKTIQFQSHRTFDLLDCRIDMLPLGLARKRYFNRKYPIQLIIKQSNTQQFSRVPSLCVIEEEDFNVQGSTEAAVGKSLLDDNSKSNEKQSTTNISLEADSEIDFGATILHADLSRLPHPAKLETEDTLPTGDEVRLILFARTDREKEDWYRRFEAASAGNVNDQMLHLSNVKLIDDARLQNIASKAAQLPMEPTQNDNEEADNDINMGSIGTTSTYNVAMKGATSFHSHYKIPFKHKYAQSMYEMEPDQDQEPITYEGLLMSSCAGRNPIEYIRFMAIYQKACTEEQIPVFHKTTKAFTTESHRRQRRAKRHEAELWKGIDQSLFLGPSGSVVWANVICGRILFSCLHDIGVRSKIHHLLQKKLGSIKLPSFMEDVIIKHINLGEVPPLIHRVSQPMLDERGIWVDADVTYEGLLQITVTTKLNLMRIKNQKRVAPADITTTPNLLHASAQHNTTGASIIIPPHTGINITQVANPLPDEVIPIISVKRTESDSDNINEFDKTARQSEVIYDSEAESEGATSSEEENPIHVPPIVSDHAASFHDTPLPQTAPGNARRIFRIVDRIATSNLFQYATDLPYVQRAMENMSTNITLRVDLKGLVGRVTMNIPPPPSDRVWLSFRGPPRLWISAKPAVGDKSVDYTIVTSIIESKICEELNKILVYPNMVDITLPILGSSTYEYNKSDKPDA